MILHLRTGMSFSFRELRILAESFERLSFPNRESGENGLRFSNRESHSRFGHRHPTRDLSDRAWCSDCILQRICGSEIVLQVPSMIIDRAHVIVQDSYHVGKALLVVVSQT